MRVVIVGLVCYWCCLLSCVSGVAAQNVVNADANNVFHVIGGDVTKGWNITGQSSNNPTLNMVVGKTYYISMEFNTVNSPPHPFGLNTSPNLTAVMTDLGLVKNDTATTACPVVSNGFESTGACVLAFTPTATTPQPLYYHCAFHPAMVGEITITGAGQTSAPTTAIPTTAAPTTPAPTNTPGGAASCLVPSLAVVLAALAAVGVAAYH